MNNPIDYCFEKHSPKFQYEFFHTPFFILCNDAKIYRNTFVCDKSLQCNIYCDHRLIQKMFKYDYAAKFIVWVDNVVPECFIYGISDLKKITKEINGKKYCEFNCTIEPSFFDKIYPIKKSVNIKIETKSAYINIPVCERMEFYISPKLHKNIDNSYVLHNIKNLYADIANDQTPEKDRILLLKMISAYETYIRGNMPHKEFMGAIQSYERKEEDGLLVVLDKYSQYFGNTCVSGLCDLYENIKDESIKSHIYNIVLYITDNENTSKYISDNPQIMILGDTEYNVSHICARTKHLLDIIVNLKMKHINNLTTAIDYIKKLDDYISNAYNK